MTDQQQENTKDKAQEQNHKAQEQNQSHATERREQIKALEQKNKITLSRIAISSIENVKNNADVGMGTITDIIAGAVCILFSNGRFVWGTLAFLVYVLLCIFKHQVPDGPISIWLKKPLNELLADTEKTIQDITETYSRKRIK